MAVATGTAMLIGAGISATASGIQAYNANQRRKEADEAAMQFAAQQRALRETDMVSGLQLPDLGAKLAVQTLGQQMATYAKGMVQSGAAGALGGIPQLAAAGSDAALKIAADLSDLQYARDKFVATNQQEIQQRDIKRQSDMLTSQLVGAQSASAMAKAERDQAIATGVTAVGEGIAGYIGEKPLYPEQGSTAGLGSTAGMPKLEAPKLEKTQTTIPQSAPEMPQIQFKTPSKKPMTQTQRDIIEEKKMYGGASPIKPAAPLIAPEMPYINFM